MKTREAFNLAKGLAGLVDPTLQDTRLSGCSQVEEDHEETPRVFCHVFHVPGFVCVATDFKELKDEFQLGILLHEFGHLATASEWEEHADAWVREVVGIPLEYRESLEWVSMEDVGQAYGRLVE